MTSRSTSSFSQFWYLDKNQVLNILTHPLLCVYQLCMVLLLTLILMFMASLFPLLICLVVFVCHHRTTPLISYHYSPLEASAVDSIYPAHANALRKAGLAPSVFPTIVELWEKQDEKLEKKRTRRQRKEKQKCLFLCCLPKLFFYGNPQGDRQDKSHLTSLG